MGEIQKFFKENGFDSSTITLKELATLVKMINDFFLLRHGTAMMEFAGFV